jgi:hypothetical protein
MAVAMYPHAPQGSSTKHHIDELISNHCEMPLALLI